MDEQMDGGIQQGKTKISTHFKRSQQKITQTLVIS